jgi:hypothetical protein
VNKIEPYQIEYLSLKNEGVQRIYDLLNWGAIVPPVQVENIYVRAAELFERRIDRYTKRFGMIPCIVNLVGDLVLASLEAGCILDRF